MARAKTASTTAATAGDVVRAVDVVVAPKSRRCRTGRPLSSPEEIVTAPVQLPAGEFGVTGEAKWVTDLREEGGGGQRPVTGFVTQGGAVGVE